MSKQYYGIIEDVLEELRSKSWRNGYADGYLSDIEGYGEAFVLEGDTDALDNALKDALVDAGIIDEDEADDMESDGDYPFLNFALDGDEWFDRDSTMECYSCGKVFLEDGWGMPDGLISIEDDGYYCEDCIHSDPNMYIDYLVEKEGEYENEVLTDSELKEAGFEEFDNDYYGIYSDYDDGVNKVEAIRELCPDAEVIIDDRYTTYVRNFEEPEGYGNIELDDIYDTDDWVKYIKQELELDDTDANDIEYDLRHHNEGAVLSIIRDRLSDEAIEEFMDYYELEDAEDEDEDN